MDAGHTYAKLELGELAGSLACKYKYIGGTYFGALHCIALQCGSVRCGAVCRPTLIRMRSVGPAPRPMASMALVRPPNGSNTSLRAHQHSSQGAGAQRHACIRLPAHCEDAVHTQAGSTWGTS